MLSYSDIQDKIPDSERARLQRLLHSILPRNRKPLELRLFLKDSFLRMSLSSLRLKSQGLWPSFTKLLGSYGFLPANLLSAEEQKQLQRNPYTIWPNRDYCVLNADALDFLASDPILKRESYLSLALHKLSAREKKDWCKYLKLNPKLNSERERSLSLYHHLAYLNCQSGSIMDENREKRAEIEKAITKEESSLLQLPRYLDEVFPDEALSCPMAWFYRDVISFYNALEESEKKKHSLPPLAQSILPLFKKGTLMVSPAPLIPSQALRWRILITKEDTSLLSQVPSLTSFLNSLGNNEAKKEGMLF